MWVVQFDDIVNGSVLLKPNCFEIKKKIIQPELQSRVRNNKAKINDEAVLRSGIVSKILASNVKWIFQNTFVNGILGTSSKRTRIFSCVGSYQIFQKMFH